MSEKPLTLDECFEAEALHAEVRARSMAVVPEIDRLTYEEDVREASTRLGKMARELEAQLPADKARLLKRWYTEVMIPALVLEGLLDDLDEADSPTWRRRPGPACCSSS